MVADETVLIVCMHRPKISKLCKDQKSAQLCKDQKLAQLCKDKKFAQLHSLYRQ